MMSLAHLFSRPWWQRMWIIQEVALAPDVLVACGSRQQTLKGYLDLTARPLLRQPVHREAYLQKRPSARSRRAVDIDVLKSSLKLSVLNSSVTLTDTNSLMSSATFLLLSGSSLTLTHPCRSGNSRLAITSLKEPLISDSAKPTNRLTSHSNNTRSVLSPHSSSPLRTQNTLPS
jgi:hypothetical protein